MEGKVVALMYTRNQSAASQGFSISLDKGFGVCVCRRAVRGGTRTPSLIARLGQAERPRHPNTHPGPSGRRWKSPAPQVLWSWLEVDESVNYQLTLAWIRVIIHPSYPPQIVGHL